MDNHFCILWSALDISILIYPHRLSKLYDQEITGRDQPQPTRAVSEQKLTQPVWITSLYCLEDFSRKSKLSTLVEYRIGANLACPSIRYRLGIFHKLSNQNCG